MEAGLEMSSMAGYELCNQLLLPTFMLNPNGQVCLRTILHKIAITRPELVYAPQLWPLLAMLLHYHSPSIARGILLTLIDKSDFLIQTKASWKEHCLALGELAWSRSSSMENFLPPKLSNSEKKSHSSNNSPLIAENRIHLARWIFAIWQLPMDYIVRLIDCFLIEGPKIFFRAGLLVSCGLFTPRTQ